MPGTRNTSRTVAALRSAHALLVDAAWPPHPYAPAESPIVDYLTDVDLARHGEAVTLLVELDDTQIEWRSMPAARDERFTLVVEVRTAAFDTTDEALDRLEALQDVVQRAFYDDTSTLTPVLDRLDLGVHNVELNGIVAVLPVIYRDGNGFRGVSQVRYQVVAHI